MSDSYTKLFSSITESTIWGEAAGTRLVWITFLAKCSKHGEMFGAIPGIARLSNVTIEEAETAITVLLAPDKWSRTPDNDGRRISVIVGGWKILNHAKFDKIRNAEERAEYKRNWDRENRPSRPNSVNRTPDKTPTNPDEIPTPPTPPTPTPDIKAKPSVHFANARFEDFWKKYPARPGTSKKNKKAALAKWTARKLDSVADLILVDIEIRLKSDVEWKRGFMQDPVTYLNQDRWCDDKPSSPSAQPVHTGVSPSVEQTPEREREGRISWLRSIVEYGDEQNQESARAELLEMGEAL